MITEAMLRSRKRGFELEVERYIQESVSARTPKLEEIDVKKSGSGYRENQRGP